MSEPLASRGIGRRKVLGTAAAAGLAVPAAGLLSACATGGGSDSSNDSQGEKSNDNPFGVKADLPLDVVIFKGGYGDDYAKFDEQLYKKKFPKAKIGHNGTQQIGNVLNPRFAGGNPPDVIDDSGAQQIKIDTLIAKDQLTELTPLLDAPSIDDPKTKVRDTLAAGTIEQGTYGDKVYALNYGYTVFGLWYSSKLFKDKGWEYPKTWDDFIALCKKIKAAGTAPFAFQGKYPYYMMVPIMDLVAKNGGLDAQKMIDNLQPNAWKQEAVTNAVNAVYELVAQGLTLPGTNGMTHTESQTAWCQGKAAFIPCGSWLPNEQKAQTPAGFDMVVAPMPSLAGDKLPFEAVRAGAGEPFIVPKQAKNAQGGLEFLRIMLSKEAGGKFAELTQSLSVVKDSASNITATAVTSGNEVVKNAGSNIIIWRYLDWYSQLETACESATGELMAGRIKPADWQARIQKAADGIAKDDSIKKFHRN